MWRILKIRFKDNIFYGKSNISDICKVFEGTSDSIFLPFLGNRYYVPKPAMITEGLLNLNIKDFKYHRVMKYLEIADLPLFFGGGYEFEKKAVLSFGRYTCDGGVKRFLFAQEAGIYAVILSNDSDKMIIKKVKEAAKQYGEIEFAEMAWLCESVGEKNSRTVWLLLSNLDTTRYSLRQLNCLLKGSFYQVGHMKNSKSMLILPGACFVNKWNWLDEKMVLFEVNL